MIPKPKLQNVCPGKCKFCPCPLLPYFLPYICNAYFFFFILCCGSFFHCLIWAHAPNFSPFLEIIVNETYFFHLTIYPSDQHLMSSCFLHTHVSVCWWLIIIRKTCIFIQVVVVRPMPLCNDLVSPPQAHPHHFLFVCYLLVSYSQHFFN